MACKLQNDGALAVGSYLPVDAFKLLEIFCNSAQSTRWKLSNWNGVLSLLVVWGGRKNYKRISNKGSNSLTRRRSYRSKRSSFRGQGRDKLDLDVRSSTSYSRHSSDEFVSLKRGTKRKQKSKMCIDVKGDKWLC